jgi:hypothetical protein
LAAVFKRGIEFFGIPIFRIVLKRVISTVMLCDSKLEFDQLKFADVNRMSVNYGLLYSLCDNHLLLPMETFLRMSNC